MAAKSDLDRQIADLLADPAYEGHPLRVALEALWKQANEHMVRIERVTQISDAYQSMALQREQGLYERFDRQLQRLARIARISDHYQSMMRDLNHTLEETSRRDPLTGLFNRRALMDIIRTAVERSDASGRTFVIAMLDVDHFKSVNDRFGHETGDRVLVELAGFCSKACATAIIADAGAERSFSCCCPIRILLPPNWPWTESLARCVR
ncbi:diguanylate cyclase domain protein [Bordetella holmesii 35009]|nr:diguanylate cyclase domain protein [Bordetella holmesii 35009]